ncbi:MAG: hypothetical protein JW971_00830 [Synergistales bacterium]|nr:hypothetical protein [Synergistales bacterium]
MNGNGIISWHVRSAITINDFELELKGEISVKKSFFVLFAVMFMLICSGYGYAAELTVSTADGFQDALDTAGSNSEDDTITLLAGTYKASDVDGGSFGFQQTDNSSLTIVGQGNVVLDGEGLRILLIDAGDMEGITIQGITFQEGYSGNSGGALEAGISSGKIELKQCAFYDNTSENRGGAAYIRVGAGDVTITGTVFNSNKGDDSSGALDVGITEGSISLYDNVFSNNESYRNTGAAYLLISGSTGFIEVDSCDFTGNRTYGYEAGALWVSSHGEGVLITNSRFDNNMAETRGGGAYLSCENGFVLVQNCLFSHNSSTREGAGFYLSSDSYSPEKLTSADIINNTITGNVVSGDNYGGGVYVRCGDPDTAYSFYNNIIWGNSADAGADVYLKDERKINSYSFNISNNDLSVISHDLSEDTDILETANINEDPLFVSPTDYRLQGASPVIDMGDNNAPSLPESDLDGNARIYGDAVDMGAYEYSSGTGDDDDDDIIGSSSGCSISALPPIGFILFLPLVFLAKRK